MKKKTMKQTFFLSAALTALSLHTTLGSETDYALPSFPEIEDLPTSTYTAEGEEPNISTTFNKGATVMQMPTHYPSSPSPEDLKKIREDISDMSQDEQDNSPEEQNPPKRPTTHDTERWSTMRMSTTTYQGMPTEKVLACIAQAALDASPDEQDNFQKKQKNPPKRLTTRDIKEWLAGVITAPNESNNAYIVYIENQA